MTPYFLPGGYGSPRRHPFSPNVAAAAAGEAGRLQRVVSQPFVNNEISNDERVIADRPDGVVEHVDDVFNSNVRRSVDEVVAALGHLAPVAAHVRHCQWSVRTRRQYPRQFIRIARQMDAEHVVQLMEWRSTQKERLVLPPPLVPLNVWVVRLWAVCIDTEKQR